MLDRWANERSSPVRLLWGNRGNAKTVVLAAFWKDTDAIFSASEMVQDVMDGC